MKQKSKCSYSWYHLYEETAVVQLLFASGVRDLQYGILQFQLLVMVWFLNFIFSSASSLCFLWGRELKGAFWQCPLLSPQACSCYCNGSSVYLLVCFTEILVSNGFIFRVLWIICWLLISCVITPSDCRENTNSLSASKMGMGCVLAGSDGHVWLSCVSLRGRGAFLFWRGRILLT